MKNINIYFLRRLFVVAISIFFLGITSTLAQIGNLGIYGSAPTPAGTAFPCGTPEYARIEPYPDYAAGDDFPSWSQTLPLNGVKNFNFFYTANGQGFLSGGGYKVRYFNASQATCYGSGDIVTYSPNSGHTNGVQVRSFNPVPTGQPTPLGIYGTILVKIPGGGGATAPLENADVAVTDSIPALGWRAKTNGSGFFSIYYSSQNVLEFVPPDNVLHFYASGMYGGCPYSLVLNNWVVWLPYNTSDPSLASYYTTLADWEVVWDPLTSTGGSNCQP